MSVSAFIVNFFVSWLIILFILLPIGNSTKNPMKGQANSAPDNPRIKLKIFSAMIISLIFTYIFMYLLDNKIIDLEKYFLET